MVPPPRLIGSRNRVRAVHDGCSRWEPVPPVHAVDRSGAAACGAAGLIVFVETGVWDDVDPDLTRCATCIARLDGAAPVQVEVRNLNNGLDIDAAPIGALVVANLDALVGSLRRLASRQPSTLRVDLARLEVEDDVADALAPELLEIRRVLANEGGVLRLDGVPAALARALPVDVGRS